MLGQELIEAYFADRPGILANKNQLTLFLSFLYKSKEWIDPVFTSKAHNMLDWLYGEVEGWRPPPEKGIRIVCAAIRLGDKIIAGPRHFDATMHQSINRDTPENDWKHAEQGFIDQWGRFYDRTEACVIALINGQRHRSTGPWELLFSEELY